MAQTIKIERILEQRDVDAALYLLGRMLALSDSVVGERRAELAALRKRLSRSRHISGDERLKVVRSYREVIG